MAGSGLTAHLARGLRIVPVKYQIIQPYAYEFIRTGAGRLKLGCETATLVHPMGASKTADGVIPADAGIHFSRSNSDMIPPFAGMTSKKVR
jgi:hypothetical protein